MEDRPREFIGFVWQDEFSDQTGMLVEAADSTEAVAIVKTADGDDVSVSLWNDEHAAKPR